MVRDSRRGSDTRRAHQAFQDIKTVEIILIPSVGTTKIDAKSADDRYPPKMDIRPPSMIPNMEHTAAPAIDSSMGTERQF
jgi:hypothetical protein